MRYRYFLLPEKTPPTTTLSSTRRHRWYPHQSWISCQRQRRVAVVLLTVVVTVVMLSSTVKSLSVVTSYGYRSHRVVGGWLAFHPAAQSGCSRRFVSRLANHPNNPHPGGNHNHLDDGDEDYRNNNNNINNINGLEQQSPPLQSLPPPPMANLYREWSLEQDRLLWNNKRLSPAELASLLGRGIRGVEARLSKLQDVSSPAYERLFASTGRNYDDDDNDDRNNSPGAAAAYDDDDTENDGRTRMAKEKLVPVGQVLRRIEWDDVLPIHDFSILHYDRVQDEIVESPVDAPNTSVAGKATLLIKALPEHRIVGVKYKERIVWDRAAKLDLVFSDPGIYHIMETYEEWKEERDRVQAWNRERQKAVADRIERILGVQLYGQLQQLSSDLIQAEQDPTLSIKTEVERYVQQGLELFRTVRIQESTEQQQQQQQHLEPELIPEGDYDALDELSELVAVLPNVELRGLLLAEIAMLMKRTKGKGRVMINQASSAIAATTTPTSATSTTTTATSTTSLKSVELVEEDLIETFVRGSGPGGQKINKTSNRVVLIHEPTQLRVECQDTRSLQQNRKIARKRLAEKLDEYLNGSQSKLSQKVQKTIVKKQKQKSKNKARLKKKQLEKHLEQLEQKGSSDENDFY